ncbi:hypothetical protein BDB01DRAFT_843546 [Pilobolus umbonatus]|nr:hypothetical protein BDB01DRAFT_843546 [Pilobolus umbonatus]
MINNNVAFTTVISALPTQQLTDTHGRHHNYLRISVTERCNLRCTYCMPEEGVTLTSAEKLLRSGEIIRLASLFVSQGVTKIRLTGGEPTVRSDIIDIVRDLGRLKKSGLTSLAMTTNGIALKRKLPSLYDAGLDTLNISLDTLDKQKFEQITRRNGLVRVLDVIEDAIKIGIPEVKMNVVVMKGFNDREVLDFVAYTKHHPVTIRFIEYMPFDGNRWDVTKLVPYKELLYSIESKYGHLLKSADGMSDTTKHYSVPGYQGKIGFISSMTDHFCGTCNRLRITADGNIKVCLFGNGEVSLRDMMRQNKDDESLLNVIGAAVRKKKAQHAGMFELASKKNRPMILIGGKLKYRPPGHFHWMAGSVFRSNTLTSRYYGTSSDDESPRLTHTDATTGEARMVSVSDKEITKRTAIAMGRILLPQQTFNLLEKNESHTSKGNVLTVAQIAGIQAAKSTSNLIPLCHPLMLSFIDIRLWLDKDKLSVECESTVQTSGKTGVEMEALTATSIALLTVYDMCKASSKEMVIQNIRLLEKTGGKSGQWSSNMK